MIQKTVEKLEQTVHDSNIKIEELNRTVNEVTAQKTRLSAENTELIKEVHEYKVSLDNANHLKTQLASQLEDARRRLEDEERVSTIKIIKVKIKRVNQDVLYFCFLQKRSSLEAHCHTIEIELESLKVQLEEESEARLDIERQLAKANGDAASWKSKFEAEVQAHADECEELRLVVVL